MKRPILALLRKEIHLIKFRFGMISVGIILLNFALYLLTLRGLPSSPFGIVQLLILFLLALWLGYERMQDEWAGGQATLLLTLPVPGWYHTGVKTLVTLAEVVWYAILAGISTFLLVLPTDHAFLISGRHFEPEYALTSGTLWGAFLWLILNYAFIFLILTSTTQIAFVVSRTASRRRGVTALLGGGLFLWFIDRVGSLLAPAFAWLPPAYSTSLVAELSMSGSIIPNYLSLDLNQVPGAEIAGVLIAMVLAYFIVGQLLERRVQTG